MLRASALLASLLTVLSLTARALGAALPGDVLAFTALPPGRLVATELYLYDLPRAFVTRLTRNFIDETIAAWSPDGERLLFRSSYSGPYDLYALDLASGHSENLTRSDQMEGEASWSPDGAGVVFSALEREDFDLYLLRSGARERLTRSVGHDDDPAWSPDGSRIAFSSARDGNFEIYLIDADGANARQITHTAFPYANTYPFWSPDGRWLAFVQHVGGGDNGIVRVDPADGAAHVLLDAGRVEYITAPAWSPDGRTVAFGVQQSLPSSAVYLLDLESGVLRAHSLQVWRAFRPLWKP